MSISKLLTVHSIDGNVENGKYVPRVQNRAANESISRENADPSLDL